MASIDDDLGQIERDIRTLKIEYEQFFGGGRPRPPADTQWRVDSMMRRYNERSAELSAGQRFRFNNIQQTYAKYQDMWRKKTVQKETGAVQHHFGAAAKAIEIERARKAIAKVGSNARSAKSDTVLDASAKKNGSFLLSISDPDSELEKVNALYQHLIDARSQTGENSGAPSLKDFERFVRQKTKELQDKGGKAVEYSVSIEKGRVKLKAKVSGS
jgi:hypothetical protein